VLVVGAGPVGAVLALELAHHGVPCVVVERAVTGPHYPGLDRFAGRSMQLLGRLGLATLIRRHGSAPDQPTGLEWTQGLDDPPILSLPGLPTKQLPLRAAGGTESPPMEPCRRVFATQLARQLRAVLREHHLIDLREGWTFTGLRIGPADAVADVVDARTGDRRFIEAEYVAGCDGAHSTMRRCLGVPMERLAAPARHCSVYFRSAALMRRFADRDLSTIIVGGVAVVSRGEHGTWVGHIALAAEEPVTTDPVAMLGERLGIRLKLCDVLGVTQWDDSLAVAAAYRRGPAYLVGEAAHRFYPVSDSVDTSVGDAVDLGWKLAAVINGWGGPGLLASYELERRACALIDREMLARSLETRRRFSRLTEAGATREFLALMLHQEAHQIHIAGLQFGDRLASCVVWTDRDAVARRQRDDVAPIRSGCRTPAVRLADGSPLYDRLGPELTLVDLTDGGAGRPLVAAARRRRIPMTYLPIADPGLRACWDHSLVLVRPDQHIAWRSGTAPADWGTVLDLVTGHKTT
jgi:2-polyprenyl-6-methoxyphenol hydroxylase-like FAD-dependent oxidoreductase